MGVAKTKLDDWYALEPHIRRLFAVDSFFIDRHRRKLVLVTWGTVRLDMLQELATMTGSRDIFVIAWKREQERADAWDRERQRARDEADDVRDPEGDCFPEGLLIQVHA